LEIGQGDVAIVGRQFKKNPGCVWASQKILGCIFICHIRLSGVSEQSSFLSLLSVGLILVCDAGFEGRGMKRPEIDCND
jgi:hypothetical protein